MALKFNRQIEESSDNYVKLKSGESIVGVLRGDTLEQYKHWVDKKPILCSEGGCELCATGNRRKFSFKVNFLTKDNGVWTAKILDKGASVYKEFKNLSDNDWDLEKTWIKITRQGDGLDTEYSVTPSKKELSAAELKQISEVELLDLEEKAPQNVGQASSDEDVPF